MGNYKKIGLSHETGLIDTPPFIRAVDITFGAPFFCQKKQQLNLPIVYKNYVVHEYDLGSDK